MKDRLSLIAAAAGGFMLSIAAASIIHAAPVTSLKSPPRMSSTPVLEGTLKKQDYQIKQLEFELAQQQYQHGKINKAVLDQKAAQYQKSKREFLAFGKSLRIAD